MKEGKKSEFVLKKRAPLFIGALFFAAGSAVCARTYSFGFKKDFVGAIFPIYAVAALVIVTAIICFLLYGFSRKMLPAVLIFIAAVGFMFTQIKIDGAGLDQKIIPHDYISGRIEKVEENGENSLALILSDVTLIGEETQKIPCNINLIIYGQSSSFLESEFFLPNSAIKAEAQLLYPSDEPDYGFISERYDMLSQNVFYKALAHYSSIDVITDQKIPFADKFLYSLRKNIFGKLERYVGGDEGLLLKSLLTGNKSGLTSDIKSNFSKLGISHLLATSGLHIGILLLVAELFLKKIRAPITLRAVVSAILIFLFMSFAGFRVSMVRASIMWAALIFSRILGRKINLLNSLGIAMLIMMIVNPLCVFDISFILSCVCVMAIGLFSDEMSLLGEKTKKIKAVKPAFISAAIVCFTWPVSVYYFNTVAWLSPLYNIIFIPLSGVALLLAMIFALLPGSGILVSVLGVALEALSFLIIKLAGFLSAYSPGIKMISPSPLVMILWFAGMAFLSGTVVRWKDKAGYFIASFFIAAALVAMFIAQSDALKQVGIKAYAEGSRIFFYFQNEKENVLIMNESSYIANSLIEKSSADGLDILIYSGSDYEGLEEILDDLDHIEINWIYAAKPVADEFYEKNGYYVYPMNGMKILGYEVEFEAYKAKSTTAKTHYAVKITQGAQKILYLDPLYLRENTFSEIFSSVVASRWSKSRADNIRFVNFEEFYYCDLRAYSAESIYLLEHYGAKTYNITQGTKIFFEDKGN